ncbi:hypothetical protein ANANG_G00230430, partial [Anguilla anguilla]
MNTVSLSGTIITKTHIPVPPSPYRRAGVYDDGRGVCVYRVGVCVDRPASTLSFYSVSDSDTLTLLHRFHTHFTQHTPSVLDLECVTPPQCLSANWSRDTHTHSCARTQSYTHKRTLIYPLTHTPHSYIHSHTQTTHTHIHIHTHMHTL